jgi:inosose dehydratase
VVISTGAWLHRTRPDMRVVARVIDEVARAVADAGAVAALCAQWGTEVATASELFAVLDRSSAVQACPDTAHLMAAGDDPAATVRACEGRLAAIRLNDLGADGASRPLGEGRLDVTAVLDAVDGMEYDGWITVSAARSSHQAIGRWASVRAGGR